MLGLAEKNISPTVVNDQIGRLTFTSELVRIIDYLYQLKLRSELITQQMTDHSLLGRTLLEKYLNYLIIKT